MWLVILYRQTRSYLSIERTNEPLLPSPILLFLLVDLIDRESYLIYFINRRRSIDHIIARSPPQQSFMASSNRHWPSLFKSKPCNAHHQWQHDINHASLLSNPCQKPPFASPGTLLIDLRSSCVYICVCVFARTCVRVGYKYGFF